jgi:hypothetical protein
MFWKKNPADDPHSFGNLVVKVGYCTQEQLQEAIAYQTANPNTRIGEYFVREGIIDESTIEVLLVMQMAARGKNSAILKFAKLAQTRAQTVTSVMAKIIEEKAK